MNSYGLEAGTATGTTEVWRYLSDGSKVRVAIFDSAETAVDWLMAYGSNGALAERAGILTRRLDAAQEQIAALRLALQTIEGVAVEASRTTDD